MIIYYTISVIFQARDTENDCNIGVIVCKLDHDPKWRRGYIAMLAVEEAYRRRGIGKMLVQRSIEVMREKGCDEVSFYPFYCFTLLILSRLCLKLKLQMPLL